MDKRQRAKIVRNDLPQNIRRKLVLADKLSLTVSAMSKALDDPDMSEKAIQDVATLARAVERANEAYIDSKQGIEHSTTQGQDALKKAGAPRSSRGPTFRNELSS